MPAVPQRPDASLGGVLWFSGMEILYLLSAPWAERPEERWILIAGAVAAHILTAGMSWLYGCQCVERAAWDRLYGGRRE